MISDYKTRLLRSIPDLSLVSINAAIFKQRSLIIRVPLPNHQTIQFCYVPVTEHHEVMFTIKSSRPEYNARVSKTKKTKLARDSVKCN